MRQKDLHFLLRDLHRLVDRIHERQVRELGLSHVACRVLSCLHHHDGVTQIHLARLTQIEPTTLMRVLDRLQGKGFVERRRHLSDRRARRLHLLKPGRRQVTLIRKIENHAQEQLLTGLASHEREQLLNILTRVEANLRAAAAHVESPSTTQHGRT